jgi:hypothetical protein
MNNLKIINMIQGTQTGIAGARHFSIRGKVIQTVTRSKGWWIFKEIFSGLKIQLNTDQLKLMEERYGKVQFIDGGEGDIANTIDLYMDDEKFQDNSFPEGTEIGITFAKGGAFEQFFKGAEPIMIVDIKKIEDGYQLENELLPVQLSMAIA